MTAGPLLSSILVQHLKVYILHVQHLYNAVPIWTDSEASVVSLMPTKRQSIIGLFTLQADILWIGNVSALQLSSWTELSDDQLPQQ